MMNLFACGTQSFNVNLIETFDNAIKSRNRFAAFVFLRLALPAWSPRRIDKERLRNLFIVFVVALIANDAGVKVFR